MNRFIKNISNSIGPGCLLVVVILFLGVCNTLAQSENWINGSEEVPQFMYGEIVYADIDTVNNRLLIILRDGMWQYDLASEEWEFLSDLEELPDDFHEFEFAYNAEKEMPMFWDRGVGRVFEVESDTFRIKRIDESHSHKNQFKHQPFIKEGTIYAFGGYGYWNWKNYITHYDSELKEWSVQNVNPASEVPRARVPHAGAYSSALGKFYIYGGKMPSQEQRADDHYTTSYEINDIWSFSFKENSWNKMAELDQGYRFYDSQSLRRIRWINGMTSSAFSNESNVWYIPTVGENTSDELVFLTPIDVVSGQVGKSVLLPSIESNQILPTNFLFNPNTENLIIVGIKKITDRVEYPIKIVKINEDSLLSELQFPGSKENYNWLYILILIVLAGLGGTFYLKKRASQKADTHQEKVLLTEEEILKSRWLKSDEKLLLKFLFDNRGYLESMKIDEAVWPDIDNYDYCRKLRNDTINSINKKFRNRLPIDDDIINRIKDPDDKRRYLYGLNEKLVDL